VRIAFLIAFLPAAAIAGEATVVGVAATPEGSGWRFDVTVSHADEGWDHYADAWQVLGPEESVLGTRELLHPHVNEQPFTRSLSGVEVPSGIGEVKVRARDSVHGWGPAVTFTLPR
jgi:hypothetical protein